MKSLDDIELLDLIPDSIGKDKTVQGAAQAIDPQLRVIAPYLAYPSILARLDELESGQLDHLAVQFDVTVWRDSWPVDLKRSVLKTAIKEKRLKGTVKAVKDALASLGSAAHIVEWWQENPQATPHTFKVYATQAELNGVISAEMQEDVIDAVYDAKPLRSHFEFIVQERGTGTLNICGVVRALAYASIHNEVITSQDIGGDIGLEACARPIVKSFILAST